MASNILYNDYPNGPGGLPSKLIAGGRSIDYWTLYDQSYNENWSEENNVTRMGIVVAWDDRTDFRAYALGVHNINTQYSILTSGSPPQAGSFPPPPPLPNGYYFNRVVPLQNQYNKTQYLTSLTSRAVGLGKNSNLPSALTVSASEGFWWRPGNGWIVYDAVFTCPPFDILLQSDFQSQSPTNELLRYVIRDDHIHARERKFSSTCFETDSSDTFANTQETDPYTNNVRTPPNPPIPVPEVGFAPWYDFEFTYTWCKVPWDYIPRTGIANCAVKVNSVAFDYRLPVNWPFSLGTSTPVLGKYPPGTILFAGLASKIRRYRGAMGEWLADIPYLFRYQPITHNRVPRNNGTTIRILARGTGNGNIDSETTSQLPRYPYQAVDLHQLFQPGP